MIPISSCPACRSSLRGCFEVDCGGRRMTVSRCDRCGSYVKNPFFDAPELKELYGRYDHHEAHFDPASGELDALAAKVRRIERYRPSRGDLLEIGCGRGWLLSQARRSGWRAHGLEIEGSAREHLLPELSGSVDYIHGEEGFARIEAARYDVICSYQVFEHLLDPAAALASWCRALRKGGLLIVDTPNAGSLGSRLHGPGWIHHTRSEHFTLFTVRALRGLLRANGMRILRVHGGGAPPLCSSSGASGRVSARRVFRFRWLARAARALVHGAGLGDSIEIIARKP